MKEPIPQKKRQEDQEDLFFIDASQTPEAKEQFFDALDKINVKTRKTGAFRLTLDKDFIEDCFIREHEVDTFLDELSDEDLKGHHEVFDTFAFAIETSKGIQDATKFRPYLGWRPLEAARRTLENTTQLATQLVPTQMKRHVKSIA